MTMTLKDFAKVSTIAAGALLGSAVAAQADCFVTNSDKRGFLSSEQRHTRTFAGDSARTIWERYCKPFIQRTMQSEGIRNGRFGMHCTGRLSCNIEGRIENGRVVTSRLNFGVEGEDRIERRSSIVVQPEVRRERQIQTETRVEPRVRVETRRDVDVESTTRTHRSISNDPGWAAFDRMVADCERSKRGEVVVTRRPTCG